MNSFLISCKGFACRYLYTVAVSIFSTVFISISSIGTALANTDLDGEGSVTYSVFSDGAINPFSVPDFAGDWTLYQGAGAIGVGPSSGDISWWAANSADVYTRDCLFDDVFSFGSDGSFSIIQDGLTWVEVWQGSVDVDSCSSPVYPHDGSNPASYIYDAEAQTITLSGVGAYLGLSRVANANELSEPSEAPESITYNILDMSANEMTLVAPFSLGYWTFKLVRADENGSTDNGSGRTSSVEMIESFGGHLVDGNTFTYPSGAEVWGGFANLNFDIYPFTFANGGSISFTAAVPAGGTDTSVYFRFERLPHPDTDPSFNLDSILISGEAEQQYTLSIPVQDAGNTYESLLMHVVDQDSPVIVKNIVVTDDGGGTGGAATDSSTDGGTSDGGSTDGSVRTGSVEMIESFGGAWIDGNTFIYPSGAEVWGGFANLNFDIYPFSFAGGGSITFTAAVSSGGSDTSVYFRFERLPFPDVEPSFNLGPIVISGETEQQYTMTIPAQDAANTYYSLLMHLIEQDSSVMIRDIVVTDDRGSTVSSSDGGATDGGSTDGGSTDSGSTDGSVRTGPVQMIEGFGGAVVDGTTFTLPTGSEVWAGFANLNTDVYPFTFSNPGTITFTAAIPADGVATNIYFRFERLPHPDVEPSFNLGNVLISGEAETQYTVAIPAQDAGNTYESFLMYVVENDSPVIVKNIVVTHDGGSTGLPQEATYETPSSPGIEVLNEATVTTEWGGNASMSFAACGTCEEISQETVSDDQRGDVLQISYSDTAGHAVLVIANTDPTVDVSAFTELSFDIKVLNIDADVGFNLLVQSTGSSRPPVDVTPTDSEFWQTFTVPLTDLSGVDFTAVSAPFVLFPDINKGAGLVYQIDDIRWQ